MKIALDWIADYLTPTPSADAAADALMNAGLPVESIVDAIGSKGATKVLDVEVTSNRTDCLSHVGLARELAALTPGGATFTPPKISLQESATPVSGLTSIAITDTANCPYYSARIIRNVKIGPSPDWLCKRLESIGLRPINNVVDITNYVLMELGQPLHAFDYDKLIEHRIVVRRAKNGERLQAIDAKEYILDDSMLVIADARNPVAIAGIMGGKTTEVTEATANILLESAHFDPLSTRTTSRSLTLKSDASYRFERGIDPTLAELASQRAAQLILQICGGELAAGMVAAGIAVAKNLEVSMRLKRFETIVGIPVPTDRAVAILTALGFNPRVTGDLLYTRVPSHRLDVEREIDIIEEIARVMGYSHVPTLDRVTHAVTSEPAAEKASRTILNALVEAGFSEAVTVTFIPETDAKQFLTDPQTSLIHPQHAGWKTDVLRPSLLPSLLAVRRTNQNVGIPDARVFENAEVVVQSGDAKAPPTRQRTIAAVATDLSSLTALPGLLADRLNTEARMWVEPKDYPFFVRGASGEIHLEAPGISGTIGRVGLFTADIQRKYDLRNQVAGIELNWDMLISIFVPVRRAKAVPRFPGVKRDLSVVVDEAVRWAEIKAAVIAANLAFLEQAEFVTTFRNKDIGANKKSLTLTLDFRDPSRTLKSEEVDTQVQTVINTLSGKFKAVLRA